ncbi:3-oxoacyl-[acyl-carrier-protein] reductase FabG-like [Bicyclus anynana]|uniref:3-oxoacyl-[acyl-carrier-protein] reductase FabG-like n=1 Tax=Bicyclus anynana TaxID=110368 RepID=A0A6J1NZH4_BICAN|nr:3-oxoacyl-[acyl-carrier-protein] reductase FabG-like [Bicyclus anynana]
MSFENKVVLVTGAGSGIGKAIALHFAKLSAKLSLLDRDDENVEKTAKSCETLGKSKAIKIVVEMTNDEDVKRAVEKTVEEFGKIDVVVNCAGVLSIGGIIEEGFIRDFDKVMNVNIRSVAVITHYAVPVLIKSKGCIINIASICAKLIEKKSVPYTTSKAAVVQFTRNVALELAEEGVRVNSISPGFVNTNLWATHASPEVNKNLKKKDAPLKHVLQAEEIADMTVYLASDKAKSITGADFVIDSGYSLLGSQLKEDM